MKKLATLFAMTIALSAVSLAGWNFAGYFPDSLSSKKNQGGHGIAVDPAGKVWVMYYGNDIDSLPYPGTGVKYAVRPIYVYNSNGTQATFSPIKVLVGTGVNDTLWGSGAPSASTVLTLRGLRLDYSGNILASVFDRVYRINYQTGVVMNKLVSGGGNSITSVGVDTLGEIFVQTVAPGNPIKIWASNFSSLGNVADTSAGFCRTSEASKDGNDFYSANYTLHCVYRYHSANGTFGPYTIGPNDTLFKGFDCESMSWCPANGTRPRLLWASAGSGNDMPNRYPGVTTHWSVNAHYAWNPATNTIVDSLKWTWYNADSANTRPRGIAFSPDGNTAYVTCFNGASVLIPCVEKFTRTSSSVAEPDPTAGVPKQFSLSQNYPNPFNPSTDIKFSLTKAGMTTLKVYNMLGQEVATLLNETLNAGAYKVNFNASSLASGTYIYRLTGDGLTISKKMVLLK